MLHHNGKRAAVIVLLVIVVAGAIAIFTFSPEGHFIHSIRPVIVTGTSMINLSSPFNSSVYLSSDVGSCRGPAGYVPCFGGAFSQAELFNCKCSRIAVGVHTACGEFIKPAK
ncbi:MAG TPA: hypothetical protein VJZ75_10675 [Candidatus Bathyarchaeia archaeon]|nr:hypothetical protein [Candidatus Bathyarchaeia archaeon]